MSGLGAVPLTRSAPGQAFLSEPLKLRPDCRVVKHTPWAMDQVQVNGFQSELGNADHEQNHREGNILGSVTGG